MEMGKDEIVDIDGVVLMKPVSRMRTKYRSLRRQVYFFQSVSVLFCLTCCMFTIKYHSDPSTCTENGTYEAPTSGMQYQGSEEMNRKQMSTTITRLIVKRKVKLLDEKKHVPWQLRPESLAPNHIKYLTLENDSETLMVRRDGAYKVSLQITYQGIDEWYELRNSTNNSFRLEHEIQRYTDSYGTGPLTLLMYMETVNFTSPQWMKSLFCEGIFFLETGDRLKVITQSLSLIDKSEHKTVFVVYPHFST